MSFEHPNRNNESIRDVERDIMRRPPEHNTTNLDLDRMNLMLDVLGHPEHSFRVIHVTGTNGKGSTARMAEALCRAYGLRFRSGSGFLARREIQLMNSSCRTYSHAFAA